MNKLVYVAIADNLEQLIDRQGQCVEASDTALNNLQIADAEASGDLIELMTTSIEEMHNFEADLAKAFAGVISPQQFLNNWRSGFESAKIKTLDFYSDSIWDMWCDVREDGFEG
jgi:hypothetical protein